MFAFNFHSAVSNHNLSVHANVFRIAFTILFFFSLTWHMNVCLFTCCRMLLITQCILFANLVCKICRFNCFQSTVLLFHMLSLNHFFHFCITFGFDSTFMFAFNFYFSDHISYTVIGISICNDFQGVLTFQTHLLLMQDHNIGTPSGNISPTTLFYSLIST